MKYIKTFTSLILVLLGLYSHANTASTLFTVQVDRTQVQIGDSLQLIYTYNGDAKKQTPNFEALKTNFEIIASYPSVEQYSFNGRLSHTSRWTFQVEPKRKGKLLIPPLTFNGETSQAIEITVTNSSASVGGTDDIFIETVVDKNEVFVQEQLKLTYRFYYSINVDSLERPELIIDNAIVKTLGTTSFQRRVDGKAYHVFEVTYALLPQSSGTLTIPVMHWSAKVAQSPQRSLYSNFGHFQTKRRPTQAKEIQVKPIPAIFPADAPWIAAESLTLTENWSSDINELEIGTPVTREVTISAKGLEAAQLPSAIKDPQIAGLKVYIETPKLNDEESNTELKSSRVESAAIVVSSNETLTLPSIRIPWWNTNTNTVEYAILPLIELKAKNTGLALNPSAASAIPNTMENTNTLEQHTTLETDLLDRQKESRNTYLVYILFASNLLTLAGLLWAVFIRRPSGQSVERATKVNSSTSFKTLALAAKNQDAQAFYTALLNWADSDVGLKSYQAITNFAKEQSLDTLYSQLTILEASLYANGDSDTLDLEATLTSIRGLKTILKTQKIPGKEQGELADLY